MAPGKPGDPFIHGGFMKTKTYLLIREMDKLYNAIAYKTIDKISSIEKILFTFEKIVNYPSNEENKRIIKIFERKPYQFSKRYYQFNGILSKIHVLVDPTSIYNARRMKNDQISLDYILRIYKSSVLINNYYREIFDKFKGRSADKELIAHIEWEFSVAETTLDRINEIYRWLSIYY